MRHLLLLVTTAAIALGAPAPDAAWAKSSKGVSSKGAKAPSKTLRNAQNSYPVNSISTSYVNPRLGPYDNTAGWGNVGAGG